MFFPHQICASQVWTMNYCGLPPRPTDQPTWDPYWCSSFRFFFFYWPIIIVCVVNFIHCGWHRGFSHHFRLCFHKIRSSVREKNERKTYTEIPLNTKYNKHWTTCNIARPPTFRIPNIMTRKKNIIKLLTKSSDIQFFETPFISCNVLTTSWIVAVLKRNTQ